jgi:hypothetical protein
MICNFKYEHYKDILFRALDMGFKVVPFSEVNLHSSHEKLLVVRHDVDRIIRKALIMAEIENSLGIKSTYFFRVHGRYNLFEYENYIILKNIMDFEHEIGLHFEAHDFELCFGEEEVSVFLREKAILESIIQQEIQSVSEHGIPGKDWNSHFFTRNTKLSVGIKQHPFDEVLGNMKYLSDSTGVWREGCICNHLSNYTRIQCLMHPNHWFEKHYSI